MALPLQRPGPLTVPGPMVRYQTQAVLRRAASTGPLVLVGVTLDGTFFPRYQAWTTDRLDLIKGQVALAPLSPVDAESPSEASAIAMREARAVWNGGRSPSLPQDGQSR